MRMRLWGLVGLTLFGCGSDPGYEPRTSPQVAISEPQTSTPASPEAPRETVVALQTCADRYALRLSSDSPSDSYAILFDIETTGSGGITAVKVKDSMVSGSNLEACLAGTLERMEVPATAIGAQHVTAQSRSMVGIAQALGGPIALLPIILVSGGVTILVGVTIYVGSEVVEAARRRPVITKSRCLDAAAGGTFLWQELCRAITDAKKAERCWALGPESEEEKRNWCNEAFGTW